MSVKTNSETNPEAKVASEASARDRIRSAVFNAKPKTDEMIFFGQKVELRQPSLGAIMGVRERSQEEQTYQMLLNYTYVPGTGELVFEPGDVEALKEIPFGEDMQEFTKRVQKILGLIPQEVTADVKEAEKSA